MTNNGKLTDEMQTTLIGMIENGVPKRTAALACGICEVTFYDWVKRGKADIESGKNNKYTKFLKCLKKSENTAIAESIQKIRLAGEKTWTAHAWWLERRVPDDWGNHQKLDVKHSGRIDFTVFKELMKDEDKRN